MLSGSCSPASAGGRVNFVDTNSGFWHQMTPDFGKYTVADIARHMVTAGDLYEASFKRVGSGTHYFLRHGLTASAAVEQSGVPEDIAQLVYLGVAIGEVQDWARGVLAKQAAVAAGAV